MNDLEYGNIAKLNKKKLLTIKNGILDICFVLPLKYHFDLHKNKSRVECAQNLDSFFPKVNFFRTRARI